MLWQTFYKLPHPSQLAPRFACYLITLIWILLSLSLLPASLLIFIHNIIYLYLLIGMNPTICSTRAHKSWLHMRIEPVTSASELSRFFCVLNPYILFELSQACQNHFYNLFHNFNCVKDITSFSTTPRLFRTDDAVVLPAYPKGISYDF